MGDILTIAHYLLTVMQPGENTVTWSWTSLVLALSMRIDTTGQRKVHTGNSGGAL